MQGQGFTYHYNASALGLGGVLKHRNGTTTVVPSLGSVALAPTGGEGFSEITNYDKDGVSFSNARSSVVGYDSAYRTFTTSSDIYMTNLNLFGRIKVAILQTSISSTRDVLRDGDIARESNPDNARFAMHAMIRGLSIDGVEVIPELDLELCETATFEQFANKIGGNSAGMYARQFGVEEKELQTVLAAKAQPIRASFVSNLQHRPTDKFGPRKGFRLPVKNFGYVYFGEMVVKAGRRRVNLLRIEFDSSLTFRDREREREQGAAETILAGAETLLASTLLPPSGPVGGTMTVLSQDSNGAPSWP